MKNLRLILALSIFTFISCSTEDPKSIYANNETNTIYICGTERENGIFVPKIWTNSNSVNLENNGKSGDATAMTFQGDKIYTVGYLADANNILTTVIWKDYKIFATIAQDITPTSIAVNGNDVYVVGSSHQGIAKVWKNGVLTDLNNGSNASASCVKIHNNNVYISGRIGNYAVIWKNGVATYLSDGTKNAAASSLEIVGDEIYVSGDESDETNGYNNFAKYWKNGVSFNLTNGNSRAHALTISVIGNDVFIGGIEFNSKGNAVSKYWKNGIPVTLTDGSFSGIFGSLAVSNNLVYTTGSSIYGAELRFNDGSVILQRQHAGFNDILIK